MVMLRPEAARGARHLRSSESAHMSLRIGKLGKNPCILLARRTSVFVRRGEKLCRLLACQRYSSDTADATKTRHGRAVFIHVVNESQ